MNFVLYGYVLTHLCRMFLKCFNSGSKVVKFIILVNYKFDNDVKNILGNKGPFSFMKESIHIYTDLQMHTYYNVY